jgi:alkylation response protein AidB-like acyl-CoA dehydrogenase
MVTAIAEEFIELIDDVTGKVVRCRKFTVADRNERSTRTLNAVRELAPKIRAASDEIEQGRRLPLHLVEQMQRAGVFRMAMPRAWGGPELNVLSQLRVIEALSIADASAGWCAMIGNDGGYMTAYIDQTVAREIEGSCISVRLVRLARQLAARVFGSDKHQNVTVRSKE